MQFSVIGQWLLDGESPHTGQRVRQTRRIVKLQGGTWERDERGNRLEEIWTPIPCTYEVGKDYAIQLGRGQKAQGRTSPVKSIIRQDVRSMTSEAAVASGFATVADYMLLAWCPMHDKALDLQWNEYKGDYTYRLINNTMWRGYASAEEIPVLLLTRPAALYDAWVIEFE